MKKDRKELWRALKFTLFSVSAGIIQIGSYTLFLELLHWAPWVAHLVSLCLSVLWNFTLNRKYTFQSVANVPVVASTAAVLPGNCLAQAFAVASGILRMGSSVRGCRRGRK